MSYLKFLPKKGPKTQIPISPGGRWIVMFSYETSGENWGELHQDHWKRKVNLLIRKWTLFIVVSMHTNCKLHTDFDTIFLLPVKVCIADNVFCVN